jgi:hypothetical protein
LQSTALGFEKTFSKPHASLAVERILVMWSDAAPVTIYAIQPDLTFSKTHALIPVSPFFVPG